MPETKSLPGFSEALATQATTPVPLKPIFSEDDGLSDREAEVANMLVEKACSNKEIASALFITEKTVKFHLTNIYKELKVTSRAQLIVLAATKRMAREVRA